MYISRIEMDSIILLFRGAGQDPLPTLKRILSNKLMRCIH